MNPIRILFSAISGYGFYYLKTLLDEIPEDQAVICGVIDPQPEKSGHFAEIVARNVPIYSDIDSFFNDGNSADLTVISSPLQFHVPQSIAALKNGSYVLVDKPVGVTPGELKRLIAARNQTGKWVEVGYQWSFSRAVLDLKKDMLAGTFGKLLRMKTICLWPRPYAYFNRNDWAGRIWAGDGSLVLDSVANNACAHHLHNMFFLAGTSMNQSAVPVSVTGERWRAYDIQNFDTIACRIITDNEVELQFFASHVTENQLDPTFEFEFDNATVRLGKDGITARLSDGKEIKYGHPDDDHQFRKLFQSIAKCSNPSADTCPPEAALSHTLCINALHELPNEIQTFPTRFVVIEKERRWVKGIGEKMEAAYEAWRTEGVMMDR
jgi:predicted dehydrogenase